jgi:hypothetical protein
MRARYFKFLLEKPKLFIFEIMDIFIVVFSWVVFNILTEILSLPEYSELILTLLFSLVYLPYKFFAKKHSLLFKLTKRKKIIIQIKKGDSNV